MNRIIPALILSAGCVATSAPAFAAKKCNIVGPFTDSLGSTGKFTSEKKGTVSNTSICPSTYKLKVTKLSETVIDISGTTSQCGALTGAFTFNDGGCTSASGSVTIVGIGTFPDTVTRGMDVPSHHPVADTSTLSTGLK